MCAKPIAGYRNIDQLAPKWFMVAGWKNWQSMNSGGELRYPNFKLLDDKQYTWLYRKLLLEERAVFLQNFLDRLEQVDSIALLCYCREGEFCHRRILAEMIREARPDRHEIVLR